MIENVPRKLGWGRFALQVVTVVLAYVIASTPPVLLLGQTSTAIALSTLTSAAGGLLVAWLWLRSDRALADAFNLARPPSWRGALAMAAGATVAIVIVLLAGSVLTSAAGLEAPNTSGVMELVRQSPLELLVWIAIVAWGSAAFGEELLWRGFLMDRLARLPGLSGRTAAVLVIQAVLFGLPHLYQGWSGVIVTGTVGLILGWMRIRTRGNLWPLIIAHGLVDTIMLSAGYVDVFAKMAG
jgi:membrane protease YdiL (CAAX protease family)